ncbi:homeobox-like protein HDP1 [Halyomorpha halys]|uniref:homeobox-like protein HDP1 n=1 Tax=Halyomorpha halys TaxID=286706 RepID=UPI0006D51B8D|nr:uncharacterized protein LOC106682157 [Halyomorpha halys]
MNVNPLMTVWLISCVITYSDLTEDNRYSSFKYDKRNHGASELARLNGDSLASYKLDCLRLLTAEKKKKNKTCATEVTDINGCPVSTTAKHKKGHKTTTQATYNIDESCSSSSTAKKKKGNKKTKKQGIDSRDNKNSNGEENNMMNSDSGNKWKKIQKFFFRSPNWSSTKSYKGYGPTKNGAKYKEDLRSMQKQQYPTEGRYDITTIGDSYYLHPIPSVTNDQYNDKLFVKEEIIKKNMPGWENVSSRERMNENVTSREGMNEHVTSREGMNENVTSREGMNEHVTFREGMNEQVSSREGMIEGVSSREGMNESVNSREQMNESVSSREQMNEISTSNNPPKEQLNEIENIPFRKYHGVNMASTEQVTQEEKLLSSKWEDENDKISYVGLMDKTDEGTPSMQLNQRETKVSIQWAPKEEDGTPSQEFPDSFKILSTRGGTVPPQDFAMEPESEQIDNQLSHDSLTDGLIYNYTNTPSVNQIESMENIDDNNKEILYTQLFQTENTMGINEGFDDRQLQLKPEEITDNIKEKYEVSMVREDPNLSLKPEAMMELKNYPPNQTNLENPDLSFKQYHEMKSDKWKLIPNFNDLPNYEKLKNLSDTIDEHIAKYDKNTSSPYNNLEQLLQSNFDKIYNIDDKSNMTDSSNMFLKTFGNFLKNGIPEIFPHNVENLYKTSPQPIYDLIKDNAHDQKAKQYFFLNTETMLPTPQTNKSSNIQVNEETYLPDNLNTTTFRKPTNQYLQLMEPILVLKDDSLQRKPVESSASSTLSSTIMNQYTIAMWPKYTDKAESNSDYLLYNISNSDSLLDKISNSDSLLDNISNSDSLLDNISNSDSLLSDISNSDQQDDVNTLSSVHSFNFTLQSEVSTSSFYQYELNLTRLTESSSTTTGYHGSHEPAEFPKEIASFEAFVTIPLIFPNTESTKSDLPRIETTPTKHVRHQSGLNLTLHPILFNNLWNIQSYLDPSSDKFTSTTLNPFSDDKIAFENRHEFNSGHHFQTTLQPFLDDSINSEWVPLKIPGLENEFNSNNPSTLIMNEATQENFKQITDFTNINDLVTRIIEKLEKRNFTTIPRYIPFLSETNRRDLFFLNRPLEKPEPIKKLHKYEGPRTELVDDPALNEIMNPTRLRIGTSIENLIQSEKLSDENQVYHYIRKPPDLDENIRGVNLINFLPFSKGEVKNNEREDLAHLSAEPYIKKLELAAPKMNDKYFDKIEVGPKHRVDEASTQMINNDLKVKNKPNFWSNLNRQPSTESEQHKELTNKHAELDGGFNRNSTSWSLLDYERKSHSKMNGNNFDFPSIPYNEIFSKQSSLSFTANDNKAALTSNGWYVHNEQNEKILASEKSFDVKLAMSSPKPVSSHKENFDQLKNKIALLRNIMNQSSSEIRNTSDSKKDEISAVHMSAIKIIKKKPGMLEETFYDPFRNIMSPNANNTEINREMSQIFMKMQDFANKLAMKKILLKRDVTHPLNVPFGSTVSWRNQYSVLPSYKTDNIPLDGNLTCNKIKRSPSTFINDKKCDNVISNIGPYKMSDKWKYNMQYFIDKLNEKCNYNLNIDNDDIKKGGDKLLPYITYNDPKLYENQHNPLKKLLGSQIRQSLVESDGNNEKYDEQNFTNNSKKSPKRNVVGNKKMKSRELEFILERNLPRLPLNKRLFISYMMTGLKNTVNPLIVEDEKHSQLSKAYLQNLIDRNVKKDKVVELTGNKRPRKKQWHTASFP